MKKPPSLSTRDLVLGDETPDSKRRQESLETSPANDSFFYREQGGVRRAIIVCTTNRVGAAYARGLPGTHRIFITHPGLWSDLNGLQRNAVCQLVWPAEEAFIILDATSRDVIATHALKEVIWVRLPGSD